MGLLFSGSHSDSFGQQKIRESVVAGSFYPAKAKDLEATLTSLFNEANSLDLGEKVRALIVPHAGYVFSGKIAASAYNSIGKDQLYDNIFILASSHNISFGKASIYNLGNYETPIGEVPVNLEIANKLIDNNSCFVFQKNAHSREHSIEVQLPFLQHYLTKNIPIIPIVLGTQDPQMCQEIATALLPYFTENNLFIVSADFSHYPAYDDAYRIDNITANAICEGDPDKFLETLRNNSTKNIPGLVTSMCAWPAGLVLMYLAEKDPNLQFNKLAYENSGDSKKEIDKSEVVGYNAISITKKIEINGFGLTFSDKKVLVELARQTLNSDAAKRGKLKINEDKLSPELLLKTGAFVSLKKDGKLRGCIGSFNPDEALYRVVHDMTLASAYQDTRFLPVQRNELDDIEIEISVLTPMKKINDINEIQLGKNGIYISKDGKSGTFLPQVASETGWTLEEFLGHCSMDKAGLGWEGWKNADLYIYEAIVFNEKDFITR